MNDVVATTDDFMTKGNAAFLPAMHGVEGTEYDAEVCEAMACDYAHMFGVVEVEKDYAAGRISRAFYGMVMNAAESEAETVHGIVC